MNWLIAVLALAASVVVIGAPQWRRADGVARAAAAPRGIDSLPPPARGVAARARRVILARSLARAVVAQLVTAVSLGLVLGIVGAQLRLRFGGPAPSIAVGALVAAALLRAVASGRLSLRPALTDGVRRWFEIPPLVAEWTIIRRCVEQAEQDHRDAIAGEVAGVVGSIQDVPEEMLRKRIMLQLAIRCAGADAAGRQEYELAVTRAHRCFDRYRAEVHAGCLQSAARAFWYTAALRVLLIAAGHGALAAVVEEPGPVEPPVVVPPDDVVHDVGDAQAPAVQDLPAAACAVPAVAEEALVTEEALAAQECQALDEEEAETAGNHGPSGPDLAPPERDDATAVLRVISPLLDVDRLDIAEARATESA